MKLDEDLMDSIISASISMEMMNRAMEMSTKVRMNG
jgi:hypothetical protein